MNIMWTPIEGNSEAAYQDRLAFNPELVSQVKAALHMKLWRGTGEEGRVKLMDMFADICRVIGVEAPSGLVLGGMANFCGPHYIPDTRVIMMDKVSLTSGLHELAHHIKSVAGENSFDETFSRTFSLGLFKAAAPRMFEKARAEGKLMFTDTPFRGRPEPVANDTPNDISDAPEEEVA